MRFFHLSDLHIGKQLHRYNLRKEQSAVLKEIVSYAQELCPDAVVIAGDIYDKSIPSGESVTIFDDFLTELSQLHPAPAILLISGNHDSAQRLNYAASFLKQHRIYIGCGIPERDGEFIEKVTLTDTYGEVNFYLLPFLKPAYVRSLYKDNPPETYDEAVRCVLQREEVDFSARNVLVSHQFYTGKGMVPATCDSEIVSVGGIDNVDITPLMEFDYVALGHLHGAQKVGSASIRYCGTPLKYSVSESGQEKSLSVVDIGAKEEGAKITLYPFHPLRDVRRKKGTLFELLKQTKEECQDYVSVTLTDEVDPYKPKEQLEEVYPHILEIRVDNARVRKKLKEEKEEQNLQTPEEAFCSFYEEMQGTDMSSREYEIMQQIIDRAKGE